jgi:hypothetical protein
MGRGRDPLRSSGRVRGVQRSSDHLENAARVFKHVIVPEAKHSKPFAAEISIALPVRNALSMLSAVSLDDQRPFETGEINNVRRNDMLALEFERRHSAVAQHGPEASLSRRGVRAHLSSAIAQLAGAHALVVRGHTPHPPAATRLLPSPDCGRGAKHARTDPSASRRTLCRKGSRRAASR